MRGIDMSIFADLLGVAKQIFFVQTRADKVRKLRELIADCRSMEEYLGSPWADKTYRELKEKIAQLEQELYDDRP